MYTNVIQIEEICYFSSKFQYVFPVSFCFLPDILLTEVSYLLYCLLNSGRVGDKCGGRSVGSGGGGGKAPSDHDSAIDEPDPLSLDDDSLVVTEAALTLLHRPPPPISSDHNFETPVWRARRQGWKYDTDVILSLPQHHQLIDAKMREQKISVLEKR